MGGDEGRVSGVEGSVPELLLPELLVDSASSANDSGTLLLATSLTSPRNLPTSDLCGSPTLGRMWYGIWAGRGKEADDDLSTLRFSCPSVRCSLLL